MASESTLVLIAAVPEFVSPEEYRNIVASTPTSFNDIPSVLRHKQEHVSVSFNPLLDGFTQEDCADGVLYVIESALVFMSSTGRGFQVTYPAITLHAIASGDMPSIYCQLDDDPTPDEDTEDLGIRELSIVPRDLTSLEAIFEAMSQCASLHPDPSTEEEDEEFEDNVSLDGSPFETLDGEEEAQLSEVGRAALAHLESIIYDPSEEKVNGQVNGVREVSSDPEERKEQRA